MGVILLPPLSAYVNNGPCTPCAGSLIQPLSATRYGLELEPPAAAPPAGVVPPVPADEDVPPVAADVAPPVAGVETVPPVAADVCPPVSPDVAPPVPTDEVTPPVAAAPPPAPPVAVLLVDGLVSLVALPPVVPAEPPVPDGPQSQLVHVKSAWQI